MRVIKRYKNRRLYDTGTSRAITQHELADLIKDGIQLKVVDSASGEDITLTVLGKILMAEAPSWGNVKQSKELLTKVISLGGTKSMSILKNTILASFGAFQVTRDKAEQIIDDLIKKGELDKSDRKKAVLELLDRAEKSTAKWKEKVSTEAGKAQKEVTNLVGKLNLVKRDDLKSLENKVDQLAETIKELQKKLDAS